MGLTDAVREALSSKTEDDQADAQAQGASGEDAAQTGEEAAEESRRKRMPGMTSGAWGA